MSSKRVIFRVTCVAIRIEGRINGKNKIGTASVFDLEYNVKNATIHPAIARSIVPVVKTITKRRKSPWMSILKKITAVVKVNISIIPSMTKRYTNLARKITCGFIDRDNNGYIEFFLVSCENIEVTPNITVKVIINHKQATEIACFVSKDISKNENKEEKINTEEKEKRPIEKRVSFFLNSNKISFFANCIISMIMRVTSTLG